jgi:hypothetical protein
MKIPCTCCSAQILPETAEKYAGLCARCFYIGPSVPPSTLFVEHRTRRFGKTNPEIMNYPFWMYMIGSRQTAWSAYPLVLGANADERGHPVWCFKRFGASRTRVDEETEIVIGGEHEDYYDSDFCIYNDVVVFSESDPTTIYGYPREDFAPTDFHSATLVEDSIYIVGGLGYPEDRKVDRTPVYRLDIATMRIQYVPTHGDKPGWLWEHTALLDESIGSLVVWGGKQLISSEPKFESKSLEGEYELDLLTLRWSRR